MPPSSVFIFPRLVSKMVILPPCSILRKYSESIIVITENPSLCQLLTTSGFINKVLRLYPVALARLLELWNRRTRAIGKAILTLAQASPLALVVGTGPA